MFSNKTTLKLDIKTHLERFLDGFTFGGFRRIDRELYHVDDRREFGRHVRRALLG